jgi:peptidylprolyl isomerase domain and WD repeat-containing protein 1
MRNTKSQLLYISDVNSPDIHIFEDNKEAQVIRIHTSPLKHMKFFAPFHFMLSIDSTSRIEIWDPETQDFPKNTLKYTSKLDTDLYEFVKCKAAI